LRTIFSITPVADDLPADVELVSRIRQLAVGEMQPAEPNLLARLTELGLEFELVEAQVRLLAPLELLDQAGIVAGLQGAASNLLSELHLFWTVDSTNTYLLRFAGAHAEQPGGQIFQGAVCLAECQLAGKGRRGKHWVSSFGKNIAVSIGWRFALPPAAIGGLSLVAGMQVVKTLRALGVADVGLKWPNDVLLGKGKVAGILVEVVPTTGATDVVMGIGINFSLSAADADGIDQAWSVLPASAGLSRNQLCQALLDSVLPALAEFAETGFGPFAAEWPAYNLYRDQLVQVALGGQIIQGIDQGIDESGQLLLRTADGIRAFNAGEVSLRLVT
jgi:BirA family transcriptional regulator, biotin operon repressor / biotin---[acetyl-CoA-carboxylase] ligase